MVVPPLPVVSYLTSSIGLLATIHGAISLVLQDINGTQLFGQQLMDFQLSLLKVSDRLKAWENLWHMDKDTPQDLSSRLSLMYWSERRRLSVHFHFGHVEAACSVLDKQLKSMYPNGEQKGRPLEDIMKTQASPQEITLAMAAHRQELQINTSLTEKYWVANFKSEVFKKNLESLLSRTNELETESLKAFKDCNGVSSDSDVDQMRRFVQHKTYLIVMAEKSECLTKMLSERCEELESFFADLHIDQVLEKNPAERVKSISQWARSCLPSYRLQITAKIAPTRPETAVVITQDRNFDKKRAHYDLERGLQLIKEGNGEVIVPIFFRFPERDRLGDNPGVAMEMRKLRYKSHSQEGFASFVARKSPKQEGMATRDLRNTERIELSFFFAECVILLMRSRGLSRICTCALQRVRLEQYGIVYTLRLAQQAVAGTGSQCDQMACSHSSISSETLLQRLGYALAEIALGKEVGRTYDEREAAIREIEEKSWAGHLYATAVQYCLSFETEDSKDLEDFYDAVVYRMHRIYNEIVAKHYYSTPRWG